MVLAPLGSICGAGSRYVTAQPPACAVGALISNNAHIKARILMAALHREPKWGSRCRKGITDEAVARAIAGDQAAYGELVARYTALAHRTAYLLGAGADAGDVVQE